MPGLNKRALLPRPFDGARVDHRLRSGPSAERGCGQTPTTASPSNDSPVSERFTLNGLRTPIAPSAPWTWPSASSIVGLALATGYIHSTLGGLLFTLNAVGYLVAAVAMVIPLSLAVRYRWVVRLGLMGYAATTIVGWAIQGPYYSTAFIAKGIEVALIVLLAIDFARMDGNPVKRHQGRDRDAPARFGRRPAPNSSNA